MFSRRKNLLGIDQPHNEKLWERRAGNGKQTRRCRRGRWSYSRIRSFWELRTESGEHMGESRRQFF